MKFVLLLIAALASAVPAYGRTFDRCSLAREMYARRVPKSDLARWTCIAEYESSYRTHVVGPPNSDGSRDYGIFQINDRYWCEPSNGQFSYNQCNISCNQLLTDDIGNSVACARKIQGQQGWSAWSVWPRCSGNLPSINPCF